MATDLFLREGEECARRDEGDELGKRFPLRRENILGSGSGCDICLPYRSVSREHASIFQKNHRAFIAAGARVAFNDIIPELGEEDIVKTDFYSVIEQNLPPAYRITAMSPLIL